MKCKYWEKDGTCRYGTLCTFAHGDQDLRTKTENLLLNQQQSGYYDMQMGMGFPPGTGQNVPGVMGYDPNFPVAMNPFMMGFDPNFMGMAPNMGMMGFPQGYDPNLMGVVNPYTGQPLPQTGQGPSVPSGGSSGSSPDPSGTTKSNTNL